MHVSSGGEHHDAAKGFAVVPEKYTLGHKHRVFRPHVVPNPKVPSSPGAVSIEVVHLSTSVTLIVHVSQRVNFETKTGRLCELEDLSYWMRSGAERVQLHPDLLRAADRTSFRSCT